LSEFWKDLKWIVIDTGIQGGDLISISLQRRS
jgi:hypothetical protein